MSRRTDVLNKYPAPRVSAVNQAVPGCSQGSYVSYILYATTALLLYFYFFWSFVLRRRAYGLVRHKSAGRDKRVRGGGNFYDLPRRSFGVPSTW